LSVLVDCLLAISGKLPLIFPIHPRTIERLEHFNLKNKLLSEKNVHLLQPIGYLEFLGLLSQSSMVLTDSGGIQEETTFLRIPCLTLRENTERPVTTTIGTNFLVGLDPERIVSTASDVLNGKTKIGTIPPLWDGQASDRILNTLLGLDYQH